MKFSIPYNYTVYYKLPKKPSWSSTSLLDDHTVEIREVDPEETELAFNLGEQPHSDNVENPYRVEGGTVDVIRYQDDFYIERGTVDTFIQLSQSNPQPSKNEWDIVNASPFHGHAMVPSEPGIAQPVYGYSGLRSQTAPRTQREFLLSQKLDEVKKWTSQQNVYIDRLNEIASNYIIVDGKVYERVGEPCLTVTVPTSGPLLLGIEEVEPAWYRPKSLRRSKSLDDRYRFAIDEKDRALAFIKDVANRRNRLYEDKAAIQIVTSWNMSFSGDSGTNFTRATKIYRDLINRDRHHRLTQTTLYKYLQADLVLSVQDLAETLDGHSEATPALRNAVKALSASMQAYSEKERLVVDRSEWYSTEPLTAFLNEVVADLEDLVSYNDAARTSQLDWCTNMLDMQPHFVGNYRYFEVANLHKLKQFERHVSASLSDYAEKASTGKGNIFIVEDYLTQTVIGAAYLSRDPGIEPITFSKRRLDQSHIEELKAIQVGQKPVQDIDDELDAMGF